MKNNIFLYSLKYYLMYDADVNISISKDGKIQKMGFSYDEGNIINEKDLKNLTYLIEELGKLEKVCEDYTREPKYVILDGNEVTIEINYNNIKRKYVVSNLYQYLDDKGLSPSCDKLIDIIIKMNKILNKYNYNLPLGNEEDIYEED